MAKLRRALLPSNSTHTSSYEEEDIDAGTYSGARGSSRTRLSRRGGGVGRAVEELQRRWHELSSGCSLGIQEERGAAADERAPLVKYRFDLVHVSKHLSKPT